MSMTRSDGNGTQWRRITTHSGTAGKYYDSAYGRFTQQDGWQYTDANDPLSLNLYTYCWNNPVNMVDPSGHFISNLTCGLTGRLINGIFGAAKGQDFWNIF